MTVAAHPRLTAEQAWPLERRKSDMRRCISKAAEEGWLAMVQPAFVASTYGVLASEVEAEMMKHLSEGEGK